MQTQGWNRRGQDPPDLLASLLWLQVRQSPLRCA